MRDQEAAPVRKGLRIGAVDDHPVILARVSEGLRWHLPDSTVEPVTRTVDAFLAASPAVDLILLDIELHDGSDPADNVRRLIARGWPVLLFTQDLRMHLVSRTFRAGASGILSKGEDLATIAFAVGLVATGSRICRRNGRWPLPTMRSGQRPISHLAKSKPSDCMPPA